MLLLTKLQLVEENLHKIKRNTSGWIPNFWVDSYSIPIVSGGSLTLTFNVKLNLKVKIYPILSLSPSIEVGISKFGQKCILALLTHWGRDKMTAIFQTFWNEFPWMKMCEFRLKFHWSLFLGSINNIPTLDQIMAWRRPGDKPLYDIYSQPIHIIWYKWYWYNSCLEQYNTSNEIHINPARSDPALPEP